MIISQAALQAIRLLNEGGYEAYLVGGCVRDDMLGILPHDYDICTAALPEEMQQVFHAFRTVETGLKHGTLTVLVDSEPLEITTYRLDGEYLDNRHPKEVTFTRNLENDLSRRDFTVNAMAYSPARGFADPFGGREDLKHKILRAVGDPDARFREDSLRILRGVRFAVKYGLTPEEKTLSAMFRQRQLMENLARERVFEELSKLLPLVKSEDLLHFAPVITAVIPELEPMLGFDHKHPAAHCWDVWGHTTYTVDAVEPTPVLRLAALLHQFTIFIPTPPVSPPQRPPQSICAGQDCCMMWAKPPVFP